MVNRHPVFLRNHLTAKLEGPGGCQPKNQGDFAPKMDGENHGKTLLKFMIWGVKTPIFGNTQVWKKPEMPTLQKREV